MMWKLIIILGTLIVKVHSQVIQTDVRYYLWNNRTTREQLSINNYGNNIIQGVPVKILIHGWMDSINSIWYPDAINNYRSLGYNVICIDWSRDSLLPYNMAASRLNAMGEFIAQFVIGLSRDKGIPVTNFHIIGHSLGGHLAGFTGQNVQSRASETIGRITGLDPAGPGFITAPENARLSTGDANRVDAIHTDAGNLGILLPVGHVDYWVNGGTAIQPGCFFPACSHLRSTFYFNEGILSNNFIARECSDWITYLSGLCSGNPQNRLGENVDFSTRGKFYLGTNSLSPYARG